MTALAGKSPVEAWAGAAWAGLERLRFVELDDGGSACSAPASRCADVGRGESSVPLKLRPAEVGADSELEFRFVELDDGGSACSAAAGDSAFKSALLVSFYPPSGILRSTCRSTPRQKHLMSPARRYARLARTHARTHAAPGTPRRGAPARALARARTDARTSSRWVSPARCSWGSQWKRSCSALSAWMSSIGRSTHARRAIRSVPAASAGPRHAGRAARLARSVVASCSRVHRRIALCRT